MKNKNVIFLSLVTFVTIGALNSKTYAGPKLCLNMKTVSEKIANATDLRFNFTYVVVKDELTKDQIALSAEDRLSTISELKKFVRNIKNEVAQLAEAQKNCQVFSFGEEKTSEYRTVASFRPKTFEVISQDAHNGFRYEKVGASQLKITYFSDVPHLEAVVKFSGVLSWNGMAPSSEYSSSLKKDWPELVSSPIPSEHAK